MLKDFMALCLLNIMWNSTPFLGTNLFAQALPVYEKHNVQGLRAQQWVLFFFKRVVEDIN